MFNRNNGLSPLVFKNAGKFFNAITVRSIKNQIDVYWISPLSESEIHNVLTEQCCMHDWVRVIECDGFVALGQNLIRSFPSYWGELLYLEFHQLPNGETRISGKWCLPQTYIATVVFAIPLMMALAVVLMFGIDPKTSNFGPVAILNNSLADLLLYLVLISLVLNVLGRVWPSKRVYEFASFCLRVKPG